MKTCCSCLPIPLSLELEFRIDMYYYQMTFGYFTDCVTVISCLLPMSISCSDMFFTVYQTFFFLYFRNILFQKTPCIIFFIHCIYKPLVLSLLAPLIFFRVLFACLIFSSWRGRIIIFISRKLTKYLIDFEKIRLWHVCSDWLRMKCHRDVFNELFSLCQSRETRD